jgi:hypothetical protein
MAGREPMRPFPRADAAGHPPAKRGRRLPPSGLPSKKNLGSSAGPHAMRIPAQGRIPQNPRTGKVGISRLAAGPGLVPQAASFNSD